MAHDFEDRANTRVRASLRLALGLLLTAGVGTSIGCGDDSDNDGTEMDAGDPGDGDGDTNPGDGDGDTNPGDGDGDTGDGDGDKVDAGDGDSDAGTDAGEPQTGFREIYQGLVPMHPQQADRFTQAIFADNQKFYAAGFVTGTKAFGNTAILDQKMAVARLTLEGKLDTTFGDDDPADASKRTGIATINLIEPSANNSPADTSEAVKGIVVQDDGKILVAGTVPSAAINNANDEPVPQTDVVIARLTADGKLDVGAGGFSIGDATPGYTIVSIAEATESFAPAGGGNAAIPHDDVGGLALDSQKRIILFARGKSTTGDDANRYVLRFDANGTLDGDFGVGGKAERSTSGQFHENAKLGVILENDVIVSPGYTNIAGKNHIVVFKIDADGNAVEEFGDDGKLEINPFANDETPSEGGFVEAYAAAFQSDGKFVTTGYGKEINDSSRPNSLFSLRFSADAELDANYGLAGKFFFNLASMNAGVAGAIQGRNAIVLNDDRIVQVGNATPTATTSNADGLVLLLDKNGNLDTEFNGTGYKAYDFGLKADALYGLAKSPDGKHVVAAGYAGAGGATGQNSAFEDGAIVILATE